MINNSLDYVIHTGPGDTEKEWKDRLIIGNAEFLEKGFRITITMFIVWF